MVFKILCLIVMAFLHVPKTCGDPVKMQARLWMLETYEHIDASTIVDTVKDDLLSKDALIQDAGCLILLKTLDGLKRNEKKSETIFNRLAADRDVVASVADIVDSRLLGWYNPVESEEIDDDLAVYVPLLVVLGRADSKVARYILSRSFLCLREHPEILELVPVDESLIAFTINRLQVIKSRNCCMYPGKEILVDMLEKDYRYRLLEMYRNFLEHGHKSDETGKKEMKKFVVECMKYGDAKNGYVIRILAANVAGRMAGFGETDLLAKVNDISKTDPFYVHLYVGRAGYSLTELNYPVREACRKILRRQAGGN